jgi:2-polyprenyl-6-methoxyphenol hydroxylase-like FAD-dependent oxidoreductase
MGHRSVDVVIAGAGPTGSLLASELMLGGVRALVVERRTEPDLALKAGGLGALAAEVLERRGLGPALDAEEAAALEAVEGMGKALGVEGGTPLAPRPIVGNFGGLFLIDQALQREPGRRMRGVAQAALERILALHAHALGVEVWRGEAVEAFEDTGSHVRVAVRGLGGLRELEAAFLVGCDGGRSTVRKQAGFDFPGTAPTLTGRQGIVELDHPERLLPLGWRRTATGMMAYGPRPGRLSVIEFERPLATRDAPVTAAELEESLRRVSGADVRITALRSATRWTDNARQASTYRRGRVLLAGDAAHIHSPFGGQGLNLGLVDATNLGWKLAATVRGDAPEGLLDTYTAERHPVAASVLDNTRAQLALMRPDPQTSALRQIMADLMTTYPDVNRHFGEMVSGVATRYDLGDDDPLVGRLVADRDLTVDGVSTRLFSLMVDGRWLLVNGRDEAIEQGSRWAARVRQVTAPDAPSMLLRPDGCITWAGRAGALHSELHRWLGPA